MAINVDRVETVTFDSFSTLVDVDSTARAVEPHVDDPIDFARRWHSRAAVYGAIGNYIDAYETYDDLHLDALEYLLATEGVEVTRDELEEMNAVYHEMEPFEDVRSGIQQLIDAGYDVGVISNGDPPMLDSLVRVADLDGLLEATVSADEIERHKPAVELYEHAAARLDTDIEATMHVSNGVFDVQGAIHAGMQGVWLNRQDAPPEPFGPEPDLTVESIDELVARLG